MDIVIRECDDWVAVYKNGQQVWGNHSCPLTEGLDALNIGFEHVHLDDEMDYETGSLKDGSDPFPMVL